ncbi:MAG: hypothetical protein ACD_76C00095G0007, partial [uncultured bacterium]
PERIQNALDRDRVAGNGHSAAVVVEREGDTGCLGLGRVAQSRGCEGEGEGRESDQEQVLLHCVLRGPKAREQNFCQH